MVVPWFNQGSPSSYHGRTTVVQWYGQLCRGTPILVNIKSPEVDKWLSKSRLGSGINTHLFTYLHIPYSLFTNSR